jgi:hypothetical protein
VLVLSIGLNFIFAFSFFILFVRLCIGTSSENAIDNASDVGGVSVLGDFVAGQRFKSGGVESCVVNAVELEVLGKGGGEFSGGF